MTLRSPVADGPNVLTLGPGYVHSRAAFARSSQFGYLTPDRGIVAVDGPGAFADGTQDSDDAFDARVDLVGRTSTFNAYDPLKIVSLDLDMIAVSGAYARGNENNRHQPDGVYYLGEGSTRPYAVVNFGAEVWPLKQLTVFV